ncbi:MAG: CNNM domain-containing protein [Gemmatimonadaceae bacterium]
MTPTFALALTVLVIGALVCAAATLRTVSRIWLRHWVERQLSGASTAALYLERPQRLILVAGTAVAIIAFVGGVMLGSSAGVSALARARAVALYAVALMFFGQIVPRAIARRWATPLVPLALPLLRAVDVLLRPLMLLVRRLTREQSRSARPAVGDAAGLEELLREGELEGVGERDEIAIISGVVQFRDKKVRAVQTPRDRIFALDVTLGGPELARRIAAAGYSRVPIFSGSLDRIVGMVHAFDVLAQDDDAMRPLRPVGRTGPDVACHDLLFQMLRERRHLSVVGDAAGKTLGIVTLEDLLEELVGDIRDEHDEPGVPAIGRTHS